MSADSIPDDIWLQICYWLPISSLLSVMLTSRRFYEIADDNSVWRTRIAQWVNISSIPKPNPMYPKLAYKHSIRPKWRQFLTNIRYDDLRYIHDNKILTGTKCRSCRIYHSAIPIKLPDYIPKSWHAKYINLCAAYAPDVGNLTDPVYEWKNDKHIEFGSKPIDDIPSDRLVDHYPAYIGTLDFDGDRLDFDGDRLDFPSLTRGLTAHRRINPQEMVQIMIKMVNNALYEIPRSISVTKKRYRNFGSITSSTSANVSLGYIPNNLPTHKENKAQHKESKAQHKANNKKKYVTKRQNSPTNLKRMNKVVQKRFNMKHR